MYILTEISLVFIISLFIIKHRSVLYRLEYCQKLTVVGSLIPGYIIATNNVDS